MLLKVRYKLFMIDLFLSERKITMKSLRNTLPSTKDEEEKEK